MDILTAITERRSIGRFDPDRKVPSETLDELLRIANTAPSSLNLQPWEVVLVTDDDRKEALRQAAFDQPKVTEASAMMIILGNPEMVEENLDSVLDSWVELGYMDRDAADNYIGMASKMYGDADDHRRVALALKNAAFFAMTVMIAARGLGLETHPMDGFSAKKVKEAFNIPDNRVIPCLIAVGYMKPGHTLLPRAYRRPLGAFVHRNDY